MKLRILVAFATVSLASLSACGSGNTVGRPPGAPAVSAVMALTRTVVVTAVYGDTPLSGLEVTLTRVKWPTGTLIAKGKTGKQGRVSLHGSWTDQEFICAGAKRSDGVVSAKCDRPLPPAVRLQFKFPPPQARKAASR
jgi:hypothetical protein